jgi:hypothetical protein
MTTGQMPPQVSVSLQPFISILNLPRKRRGAPAAPPVPRFPTNASVHSVPSRLLDAPTQTPAAVLTMHARPFLTQVLHAPPLLQRGQSLLEVRIHPDAERRASGASRPLGFHERGHINITVSRFERDHAEPRRRTDHAYTPIPLSRFPKAPRSSITSIQLPNRWRTTRVARAHSSVLRLPIVRGGGE